MADKLAIVTTKRAYLRGSAENASGVNTSGIEDEIFAGWAVRILEEVQSNNWVKVETHYGYTGYVEKRELREISEEELKCRQDTDRFYRIGIGEADLLDQPKVQGLFLELLLKNSIVELLEKEIVEGWSRVRTASGKEGYLHTENLRKRMDTDGYLLLEEKDQKNSYFSAWKKLQTVPENFSVHSIDGEENLLRE